MTEYTSPATASFSDKTRLWLTLSWSDSLWMLLGLSTVLVLSQWQLASDIGHIWWRSKTFNHCLVIPLISAWLIWQRRQELSLLRPQPALGGLLLLATVVLLLTLADIAGIAVASHFALILAVQALIWLILGTEICRRILFPIGYLWFAVPFGEFLVPKLQDITADMAVYLLRLIDLPVFRDGHFIALPNGDFLVEEACSGINYLIASLALGTLFAYMQYRSYWRRGAFVALSFIVPIVANGVRAFGIILTAHLTNNEYAVGVDHLIYGWIFFGVVMFLLFALGRTFTDEGPLVNGSEGLAPTTGKPTHPLGIYVPTLLLIAGAALLTRQSASDEHLAFSLPSLPGSWQSLSEDRLGVQLPGATDRFIVGDGAVTVIVGYFPTDSRGHELVNDKHRVYDKSVWRRLQADQRNVTGIEAGGLRLGNAFAETILVHSLYLFSDSIEGPAWRAKWHQMQARIAQRALPALYVVIARSATLPDAELDRRLGELLPALQTALAAPSTPERPVP